MSWIQSDLQQTPYTPPSWSEGIDEEIVEALQKHYEGKVDLTQYWSVGDTRTVTLSAMTGTDRSYASQNITFVLSNVGGKYLSDGTTECAFQVDQLNCLNEGSYMNDTAINIGGWKDSFRRTWCNNTYYNAIPSTIRPIFKQFINQSGLGYYSASGVENTTDFFALRAEIEVFGSTTYSVSGEGSQIKWYETSANRSKKRTNGSNATWWERSPRSSTTQFCRIDSYGSADAGDGNEGSFFAPFGVI